MKTLSANRDDKDEVGVFRTADLYQAAFFLTKRVPLIGTEKSEGKTFFLFRDEGNIEELIQAYFANAPVPVITFKSSLRELKSLLYRPSLGGR
jgi:hypothetical protein